ncbi:MAG: transcriptional regulator [Acidobacteria bacterium]|nr:MAG: transcriptional regulator [Acidobacteriota bacterium]REK03855.1 MAG: transcriptional regulator [Acidobacteriota bacterium]
MGLFAEEDGLPRIAGRIWGLMMLAEEPLHFDEIAERLQVSRASVSTNTRRLLDLHILERVTKCGDRRDYWQLNSGPAFDTLVRVIERFDHRDGVLRQAADELEPALPEAAERVRRRAEVFRAVAGGLRHALDELRQAQPEPLLFSARSP